MTFFIVLVSYFLQTRSTAKTEVSQKSIAAWHCEKKVDPEGFIKKFIRSDIGKILQITLVVRFYLSC